MIDRDEIWAYNQSTAYNVEDELYIAITLYRLKWKIVYVVIFYNNC